MVANGVHELAENAINAHRFTNKEVKKKDYKAAYCIQSAIDYANLDKISHVESEKEVCDILVNYYEEGEKVKFVKLQTLQRQYKLPHMREDEKIA